MKMIIFLILQNNTKGVIKTKTETKDNTKTDSEISVKPLRGWSKTHGDNNIYTRIRYECKECHEEFRNKKALTTHSYSHNRKYLENIEYFDINSSQNMSEFYITDKARKYIEDIDEAINNSLEEIKNCYQYRKVKSVKYKITAECEYKREPKKKLKLLKCFSTLTILLITQYMKMDTSLNGSTLKRKYMRVMAMTFSVSD